jgi:hypothetical protein
VFGDQSNTPAAHYLLLSAFDFLGILEENRGGLLGKGINATGG